MLQQKYTQLQALLKTDPLSDKTEQFFKIDEIEQLIRKGEGSAFLEILYSSLKEAHESDNREKVKRLLTIIYNMSKLGLDISVPLSFDPDVHSSVTPYDKEKILLLQRKAYLVTGYRLSELAAEPQTAFQELLRLFAEYQKELSIPESEVDNLVISTLEKKIPDGIIANAGKALEASREKKSTIDWRVHSQKADLSTGVFFRNLQQQYPNVNQKVEIIALAKDVIALKKQIKQFNLPISERKCDCVLRFLVGMLRTKEGSAKPPLIHQPTQNTMADFMALIYHALKDNTTDEEILKKPLSDADKRTRLIALCDAVVNIARAYNFEVGESSSYNAFLAKNDLKDTPDIASCGPSSFVKLMEAILGKHPAVKIVREAPNLADLKREAVNVIKQYVSLLSPEYQKSLVKFSLADSSQNKILKLMDDLSDFTQDNMGLYQVDKSRLPVQYQNERSAETFLLGLFEASAEQIRTHLRIQYGIKDEDKNGVLEKRDLVSLISAYSLPYLISEAVMFLLHNNIQRMLVHFSENKENIKTFEEQLTIYLNHGQPIDAQPNGTDNFLYIAAALGKKQFAKLLLEKGANPNIQKKADGKTSFHAAILKKDPELIELMLSHGANVHLKSEQGLSPCYLALLTRQESLALKLLNNDSDLTVAHRQSGNTLMHEAVAAQAFKVVFELVKKDPKLLIKPNNSGLLPLNIALAQKNKDMASLLLEQQIGLKQAFQLKGLTPEQFALFKDIHSELQRKKLPSDQKTSPSSAVSKNDQEEKAIRRLK